MGRCREYLFEEAVEAYEGDVTSVLDLGCMKSRAEVAEFSYGWSTIAWIKLCPHAHITTVDIDPVAVNTSKRLIREKLKWSPQQLNDSRVFHINQDAMEFAKAASDLPLDFSIIYFDGPGEHGSREVLNIMSPRLPIGTVILFDDCDLPEGKDGRRPVIPDAVKLGFEVVKDNGRQVLMKRVRV